MKIHDRTLANPVMPPFYEEAAHLLRTLVGVGLAIAAGADYRVVLKQLAECIRLLALGTQRRTHAEAAIWVLRELEASGLVTCDPKRRAKALAILGTVLGNLLTMAPPGKCRLRERDANCANPEKVG